MFRTLLISMFMTSAAIADTWTVDDDGKADFDNIQAAVDASSDGDEIVVMPGTYTGSGNYVVNMNGKEVLLRSQEGPQTTIVSGQNQRTVFYCGNNETTSTIISGFTITQGEGTQAQGGGGMWNVSSSPMLENCIFTNNFSGWGGGMLNENSNSTLTNCTFENNIAGNQGGGMYNNNSSHTLTNCTFTGNTAGEGGGMFNDHYSSPTLTGCTFTNNSAGYGGGMYNSSSSPTLTDTTVCGNSPDQINGDWTDNGGNCIAASCNDGNGDGIPDECDCPDINGDGYVNVTDLLAIIDQWGLTNSPADVNEDGIVDVTDLLIVVGNWGPCE